ncbi:MAG TPA: peptide MFS transporter [Phycisphaerae bacterium]|nr:peptide MFS transporter [Phycisphaerae bacterium]
MSQATAAVMPSEPQQRTLFGHPLGLYVLFFTEMWERFSFYAMKTLMVLYMLKHFFWSQMDSSHMLGLYAFCAYAVNPIGGLIADHVLGARKSVFIGGVLIAIGQFLLVREDLSFFYAGLVFLVCGVGLLKPNISTQVGKLYKPGDPRRDGAFTIFYMGINLGALVGPLVCCWIQVHYNSFGLAFGAAGVGMILGLIVYTIGQKKLVEFNQAAAPVKSGDEEKKAQAEAVPFRVTLDRIIVLVVIFAFVFVFWAAFEQSGNVMLIWADQHTNLRPFSSEPPPVILADAAAATRASPADGGWADIAMDAGQTQSFNPFFIFTLAPVFAAIWLWLGRRGLEPSTPTKMTMGVLAVALAFLVMWPAAVRENGPSEAPLNRLPDRIDLKSYGATRLIYDEASRQLRMNGALPELDHLRLLAASTPADFRSAVTSLVKKSAAKAAEAKRGEAWQVSETVPSAPDGYRVIGDEAPKIVKWDAASHTLTATGEIQARAESELLAAAAQPDFKAAVDKIFVDSNKHRVSVWWLVAFFMVLTCGELCLSPVGLSLVTKMAPPRYVGFFMGWWFFFTALSEGSAQIFGAWWGTMAPSKYFMMFVFMCGIAGFVMLLLVKPLKRMMHGVQ